MTSPILREFRVDDVIAIVNRDGAQCSPQLIAQQSTQGPCFTAEVDGQPIGCGGIIEQWPGVGICWMLVSHNIEPHSIWLCRIARRFIASARQQMHLHRLEAWAVSDSARNQEWLEWLGFTKEERGIAREYLPTRQTVIRYELVGDDTWEH